MNTKEINRESRRVFSSLLLPNWAERSQEDQEDYGVDCEIELIAPEDKATGFIFKVQLKGTSVPKYDESGQLVYSDASVDRFNYYINELRIPLVFVFCDVTKGDCFWSRVQGNRQLEAAFNSAKAKNQKTFTIKFPITRKIRKNAESSEQIMEAVVSTMDTITLRGLQGISPASVRDHIGHEPNIEATEHQFRLFAGLAATESIRKLVQSGDFQKASKKASDLLESESELPSVRLLGGMSLVHTYNHQLRHVGAPDATMEVAKFKLLNASKMLQIFCRQVFDISLQRFVLVYTRSARMNLNGNLVLALTISEQMQARQGQTLAGPITRFHRFQVSALVSNDFFKLLDGLYKLGSKGLFSVMPYALSEIAEGIFPYVAALRVLGRSDLVEAYVNALFEFLPFCLGVVGKFDEGCDISEILISLGTRFVGLADFSDKTSMPDLLNRFEQALEGQNLFKCLSEVQKFLRAHVQEFQAETHHQEIPSMARLREHFARQAAALGINLNDPNDPIAQVVKIGLEDLDPTRIVKNCKYIHVMIGSYGMPGEILGLPTAGSKHLVCLKHGHSVETQSLDSGYEIFTAVLPWKKEAIRCENCPDKAPHPEGWEWSEEWDAKQRTKYEELEKRHFKTQNGASNA